MIVKMFQPRFADLVTSGEKTQTIRPMPKRMPKKGDEISLRKWADKPYRSKHVELNSGVITNVSAISITRETAAKIIDLHPVPLPCERLDEFAQRDGFQNWDELSAWFQKTHGLPFSGILIEWKINE